VDPALGAGAAIPAPGGHATIHRLARRHDLEDEAPPEAEKRSLLRLAIAVAVVAVILGAGVGVLLGRKGSPPPVKKTVSTLTPAQQATQVVGVLGEIAAARLKGVIGLDAARTAAAQASAASDIERAYATGVKSLAALPAVTRSAAATQAIAATVERLARAYASLASDARGLHPQHYASERAAIEREENTLRIETKALS
jgi:hypothetical protein